MSWYTLDGFIAMLSQVFGKVEGQQAGLLDGITLGLELKWGSEGEWLCPANSVWDCVPQSKWDFAGQPSW
jgi:hypothetical protein